MLPYVCTCSSWAHNRAPECPPTLRRGPSKRAAGISQFDFRPERSLIAASSLRGETKAPRHDALESRFLNWIASAVHIRSPTKRYGFFLYLACFANSLLRDVIISHSVDSCYNLYYYHLETFIRLSILAKVKSTSRQ